MRIDTLFSSFSHLPEPLDIHILLRSLGIYVLAAEVESVLSKLDAEVVAKWEFIHFIEFLFATQEKIEIIREANLIATQEKRAAAKGKSWRPYIDYVRGPIQWVNG